MYRALTLAILRLNIDITNEPAVQKVAEKVKIDFQGKKTFLDNEDVSGEIRLPKITKVISIISAYAGVRNIMVEKQRKIAEKGGIVMDGRDIGTVVLPDSEVKIFLNARIEERTKRRYHELAKKNISVTFEQIKQEITERDRIDSTRDVAPLRPATDAHIIDTSDMTINGQVDEVLQIVNKYV